MAEGVFAQGVSSGQPRRHGAVLWTQLDELESGGRIALEVARDPGFRRVVHRQRLAVSPETGFTARARLDGLSSGERYWYRFETRRTSSPVGRFTTLRPADSREPVRVAFFSCQNYTAGYYPAHAALAEEDVDLVVCLGDYIYERNESGPLADRVDGTSAAANGQAETLSEYRAKYALYRSDPQLQAMHAAHPVLAIWDDHEVEGNYAGAEGDRDDYRVDFATRRRNAYRAFFEAMPVVRRRRERDRIYSALRLGRHAELFLLDTRQYRDPQPCDDEAPPGAPPCRDVDRPGRTMLGARQKAWLKARLDRTPATWKLIANQTMMMGNDIAPRVTQDVDGWDGYGAERRELLEHLLSRQVRDVVVLTGDEHEFYAGVVTPSGRLGEAAAATEFVGGSITSGADPDPGSRALSSLAGAALAAANPHWAYQNQVENGYALVEARRDELTVEFKAVASVFQRDAPIAPIARFRVRRGVTRVERTG